MSGRVTFLAVITMRLMRLLERHVMLLDLKNAGFILIVTKNKLILQSTVKMKVQEQGKA